MVPEGTVRFLLLTLLATVATARFEYDPQFVATSLEHLSELNTVKKELRNTYAIVQWDFDRKEKTDDKIPFKINSASYTGPDCNQMPALVLYDNTTPGPMFCLAQMNFTTITTNSGVKRLSLALGFVESEQPENLRGVFFDLLKKPSNQDQLPPGVVEAEPIIKQQATTVRFSQNFIGSASWLANIFERRICELQLPAGQQSGTKPMLKGYPIVMDAETLNRIMAL